MYLENCLKYGVNVMLEENLLQAGCNITIVTGGEFIVITFITYWQCYSKFPFSQFLLLTQHSYLGQGTLLVILSLRTELN